MGNAFPGSGTPFPANLGRKVSGRGRRQVFWLSGVAHSHHIHFFIRLWLKSIYRVVYTRRHMPRCRTDVWAHFAEGWLI